MICVIISCVCHAFASVHCYLVVTCWERADFLALVCDVYSDFVNFPCGILGQVWYLIVLFPDLCHLSYFKTNLSPSVMFLLTVPTQCFFCGSILLFVCVFHAALSVFL